MVIQQGSRVVYLRSTAVPVSQPRAVAFTCLSQLSGPIRCPLPALIVIAIGGEQMIEACFEAPRPRIQTRMAAALHLETGVRTPERIEFVHVHPRSVPGRCAPAGEPSLETGEKMTRRGRARRYAGDIVTGLHPSIRKRKDKLLHENNREASASRLQASVSELYAVAIRPGAPERLEKPRRVGVLPGDQCLRPRE
jgi:hypothetical protein